jgi:hypothetical protein
MIYCTHPHCALFNNGTNAASHYLASDIWVIARCDACLPKTVEALVALNISYTEICEAEYTSYRCVYEVTSS